LQRNLRALELNGIKVFAISFDSQVVLREFAERFNITYPLLSDEGSRVIQEFGILNTCIPQDHVRFGIPYPGTYMVGEDGRVVEKSFFAAHRTRESINDMLQETFRVEDIDRGEIQVVTTPDLTARAYFASPTVRHRQYTVLTVEISLNDRIHVNGRPLPEGYIPVELTLDGGEDLALDHVEYPEPEEIFLEALDEKLNVYTGRFQIKGRCLGLSAEQDGEIAISASLHYQACDDNECYFPETLTFPLRLRYLQHVR